MEWLKKLLTEAGLAEDKAASVVKGVEENLKDYVPKQKHDDLLAEKKDLVKQIKERDDQLTNLKKSVGDNEELQKKIEGLQSENKQKDTDYQAKIRDMQVTSAIKLAIAGAVHDTDLVVSQFDKTKIELNEDGTVKVGLDDQLKGLRESKAFLFTEAPKQQPKGWKLADGTGGNGGGDKGDGSEFGRRLAEMNKGNEGLDKARDSYFG